MTHIGIDYTPEGVVVKSTATPEATLQILHLAWVNTFMDVLKGALRKDEDLKKRIIGPPFYV